MLGMEMMFSNLIGMTPDQIKNSAEQTMKLIQSAAEGMKQISETQKRIEEKLDELLETKGMNLNGQRKRLTGDTSNNSEYVQL